MKDAANFRNVCTAYLAMRKELCTVLDDVEGLTEESYKNSLDVVRKLVEFTSNPNERADPANIRMCLVTAAALEKNVPAAAEAGLARVAKDFVNLRLLTEVGQDPAALLEQHRLIAGKTNRDYDVLSQLGLSAHHLWPAVFAAVHKVNTRKRNAKANGWVPEAMPFPVYKGFFTTPSTAEMAEKHGALLLSAETNNGLQEPLPLGATIATGVAVQFLRTPSFQENGRLCAYEKIAGTTCWKCPVFGEQVGLTCSKTKIRDLRSLLHHLDIHPLGIVHPDGTTEVAEGEAEVGKGDCFLIMPVRAVERKKGAYKKQFKILQRMRGGSHKVMDRLELVLRGPRPLATAQSLLEEFEAQNRSKAHEGEGLTWTVSLWELSRLRMDRKQALEKKRSGGMSFTPILNSADGGRVAIDLEVNDAENKEQEVSLFLGDQHLATLVHNFGKQLLCHILCAFEAVDLMNTVWQQNSVKMTVIMKPL